jgi:thermitase
VLKERVEINHKSVAGIMLALILVGMLNVPLKVTEVGVDNPESQILNGDDLEPFSVAEDPWNFSNRIEWSRFAHFNDSSAEVVIGLRNTQTQKHASLSSLTHKSCGEIVNTVSIGGEVRAVVADIPLTSVSSFVTEMQATGLSRYIEPNIKFQANFVPNDPYWPQQWGPRKIEANYAWDTTIGDPSLLVAVIDTGIDYNHPDLAGNYVALGYDWVNNDTDPMDDHDHGTHCAGIIAATLNNSLGIAGVAQVQIMAEKGLDSGGSGKASDLANAIIHAVDQGADILSNSWGGYSYSNLIHDAVKYAQDHGVLVVAAAGNEASSMKHYPAAYDEVVAVTATDQTDDPASFTSYGKWVDVAAPGVDVYSTVLNERYENHSGTSMACPHAAGVAALIWSEFPSLTLDEVRLRLQLTADDLGDAGFDVYYGYGRVNARRAVEPLSNHDILISEWKRPAYVEPGSSAIINTTVLNFGSSDEAGMTVQLRANGSTVDSAYISYLESMKSATVSCMWSPTVEGRYHVESYVVPVSGETAVENNVRSGYINVRVGKYIRVPEDCSKIQEAVDLAGPGETIKVASGTYYESVSIDTSLKLVGENRNTTVIDGNGTGTVVEVTADNVEFSGFTVRNSTGGALSGGGVVLLEVKNCVVANNTIINNFEGVNLLACTGNNSVKGNIAFLNASMHPCGEDCAIGSLWSAGRDTISDNAITGGQFGVAILREPWDPSGYNRENIVSRNVITNSERGIGIAADDNTVVNNTVTLCSDCGVRLSGSGNTIRDNRVENNQRGIVMSFSSSNRIYHNDFIHNTIQTNLTYSQNTWDDGYPSGGNHWSDYKGVDFYSGPYQNLTGSDGIGDTPYIINTYNEDKYPFIYPLVTPFYEPTAVFTYSPEIPAIDETVTFNASASLPGWNGTAYVPIANYTWNFGDGNTTTVTDPVIHHAYMTYGTYTVNLTVMCDDSVLIAEGLASESTWQNITFFPPRSPTANFEYRPISGPYVDYYEPPIYIGDTLKFVASASLPGWNGTHDVPVANYTWDFDDGNITTVADPVIFHTYSVNGTYTVNLTVTCQDDPVLIATGLTSDRTSQNITVIDLVRIRADGSVDPSTAPIQRDGDLYTFTDNIYVEILVERSNTTIDGDGYTLQGTVADYSTGVLLYYVSNVTVKNIEVKAFEQGIWLKDSSSNIICRNNVTANDWGICLFGSGSSNNIVCGNIVTANNYDGIDLSADSNHNTICGNIVTANNYDGICVMSSDYNRICGNIVTANNGYGIYVIFSSSNTIYHNDFVNNTVQVYVSKWEQNYGYYSKNVWDDGYPSGGNYWGDYSGIDLYSGPYQNLTGSDGIGDTPYVVNDLNKDRYPLMHAAAAPFCGPTAFFTHSPKTPFVNEAATFDASVSSPGWNGTALVPIANYTWNFGDGNVTTVAEPVVCHTYSTDGTYSVNLSVTCQDDSVLIAEGLTSNSAWQNITVTYPVPPRGPTAEFDFWPTPLYVGDTAIFNASVSSPGWNGTALVPIANYTWDFGDGNITTTTNPAVTHIYVVAGTYGVNLTVTCDDDPLLIERGLALHSKWRSVVIKNPSIPPPSPVVEIDILPAIPYVNDTVFFSPHVEYDLSMGWTSTPYHEIVADDSRKYSGEYSGRFRPWGSSWKAFATPVGSGNITVVWWAKNQYTDNSPNHFFRVSDETGGYRVGFRQTPYGGTAYITWYCNGTYHNIQTYSANTWYKFELRIDLDQRKYSIYINDILKVPQADADGAPSQAKYFVLDSGGEGYRSYAWIDNITVVTASDTIVFAEDFEYGYVPIVSYEWDLGDGSYIEGTTANHTYTTFGTYNVTLNVTNRRGATGATWKNITVINYPVAFFTYTPDRPFEGGPVTFNASLPTPNGGAIIRYDWSFGDGNTSSITVPTTTHVYATIGTYNVTLTVIDINGSNDTTWQTLTVRECPIAVFAYMPQFPLVNETVTFNASASLPRWNGTANVPIISYEWDLGDGSRDEGKIVNHTYTTTGTYTVTLNVTDIEGLWNTAKAIVQVGLHNVAITNVIPSKTVVGKRYSLQINVTVTNEGDFTETFNITAYANTTVIDTLTNVTLTSGNSTTITFTWNTTGVPYGNYTISAYADPVQGETYTIDNTYTGWVVVSIPGDVDGSFEVNFEDLFNLADAYGSFPNDNNWDANCDFNGDNEVNYEDLFILADHYGMFV